MNTQQLKIAYLILWGLGALISFVLQFFFPIILAEGTIWGLAIGWQREIALWNLGIIFAITIIVFKKKQTMVSVMILTTALLSLLLGINHVMALLVNSQSWVHWLASIANTIAFLSGITVNMAYSNKVMS